ncbi:MAG: NADH-quinone oxidoreductase subunit A [SAR202 cluster bacterium]|nr:NADH-quinone oxidoreductase subunit A [SAR202 cluster bacterium]
MKLSSYECGIPAAPFRWSQVHIRYYVFAILFFGVVYSWRKGVLQWR